MLIGAFNTSEHYSELMRPFPASDGHDLPGLIDEFVPGFATQCDDFVVGLEYSVG